MPFPRKQDWLGGILTLAGLALIFGPMFTNTMTVWTLVFGVVLAVFGAFLIEPSTSKIAVDEIGEAANPWSLLRARAGRTVRESDEPPVEVQPAPNQPVVITPPAGSTVDQPITVPPAPMPDTSDRRPLPDVQPVEPDREPPVEYEPAESILPAEPVSEQRLVAGRRAPVAGASNDIDYSKLGD